MVFPFEKVLTDSLKNLWTYLSTISYLNVTKIFHLINSKNQPGQLYATIAPGFWKMLLLILLKMC